MRFLFARSWLSERWNNVNRLLYRVSHSLDSYLEPTYLPIEFMWENIFDPFLNSPPVPAGAYETRFPPFPYVTRYTSYRRAQYPDETQRESIGGSWIVGQHASCSSHINAPSFITCTFFLSRSSTNWAFRFESFDIQSPNYTGEVLQDFLTSQLTFSSQPQRLKTNSKIFKKNKINK